MKWGQEWKIVGEKELSSDRAKIRLGIQQWQESILCVDV